MVSKGVVALRSTRRRRKDHARIWRALALVVCFPAGLIYLWSSHCHWPRAAKSSLSLAVAAVLALCLLPQMKPPERAKDGIVLVGATVSADILGPEAPAERMELEVYAPRRTVAIVEATATPAPTIVYCNTGGRYYHRKSCKYYKNTSTPCTVEKAVSAGYARCDECDAPEVYED